MENLMSDQGWSGSAILLHEPARGFAHFIGRCVADVYSIHDPHARRFDRHVLVSDCGPGCLAERTYHHLAGSGPQSICNHDDVTSRLFVEIVGMDDQEPDAFEIRRLLG